MDQLVYSIGKKLQSHYGVVITVVLGGITLYYLMLIHWLPGFITDDYYIFYLIDRNPHSLFISNPVEKFYLFYRPVSYLYFWLLYTICGYNSFMMKTITLIVLLASIILLVGITKNLAKYYNKNISLSIIVVLSIFVAVHPDTIQSVLWISNANELLMVFFYLLTLYLISMMIIGKIRPNAVFVVATSVTFLLSVLSKQQSLHLPFLLLLFMLTSKKRLEYGQKQILWVLFSILTLMMFFIFINNLTLFLSRTESGNPFLSLWKKPFTLIGIIGYILFPLGGLEVYGYFLNHKFLAISIFIVIALIAYSFFRKYIIDYKYVLFLLTIVVVIFIPRIFLTGGDRINVLQVFILLSISLFQFSYKEFYMKIIILLLLACTFIASMLSFDQRKQTAIYSYNANKELEQFKQQNMMTKCLVAVQYPMLTTQHSYYFDQKGYFGIDKDIHSSGIIARDVLWSSAVPKGVIVCVVGDTIIVECHDRNTYLSEDRNYKMSVVSKELGPARGYSKIVYLNPEEKETSRSSIIYYSDSGWVKLK
jgi:hypothetical protein